MAHSIVGNLEDDVKARLGVPAAENGRAMEEEVRAILRQAVSKARRRIGKPNRCPLEANPGK